MKEVIRIDQVEGKEEKSVEFTHEISGFDGEWSENPSPPSDYEKVVYLGKDQFDGDMFACYNKDTSCIIIAKGHLNSGKY